MQSSVSLARAELRKGERDKEVNALRVKAEKHMNDLDEERQKFAYIHVLVYTHVTCHGSLLARCARRHAMTVVLVATTVLEDAFVVVPGAAPV